jgi:hypothetical protein
MLAQELLKGVASGVLGDSGVAQPPVENLEVEVMDLLLLLLDGMVARGRGITYAGCHLAGRSQVISPRQQICCWGG